MRCAGVFLALLLSLSALSASTAEAHKDRLDDAPVLSTAGRKWLRGRKTMADARKDEVVEQGKGAKSTGANTAHVHGAEKTVEVTVVGLGGASQEADAPAEAVHETGKRSRKGSVTHATIQASKHGGVGTDYASAPEILGMDYNYNLNPRRHRPINNDAPLALGELAAKTP
ncbi:unnamed protein product [Miscanthus lutarioriparius]|uniref:Uncharacterized protein n=1 Tax=Miscanthus lutarioriparius TaxID=422564 RepID=A0A811N6L6_9POAL|nr:unnamed protein product [Miscanthus lutarioriparius]